MNQATSRELTPRILTCLRLIIGSNGDLVILVEMMLGHARLDGEQQVYHLGNMRVWRAREAEWKLLAWQTSMLWNTTF